MLWLQHDKSLIGVVVPVGVRAAAAVAEVLHRAIVPKHLLGPHVEDHLILAGHLDADLLVDERVAQVRDDAQAIGGEVLEARHQVELDGVIDLHRHRKGRHQGIPLQEKELLRRDVVAVLVEDGPDPHGIHPLVERVDVAHAVDLGEDHPGAGPHVGIEGAVFHEAHDAGEGHGDLGEDARRYRLGGLPLQHEDIEAGEVHARERVDHVGVDAVDLAFEIPHIELKRNPLRHSEPGR